MLRGQRLAFAISRRGLTGTSDWGSSPETAGRLELVTQNPIIVAGIPIPSDSPVFLGVLGVHVLAGLAAVSTGLIAMLSPKGRGRHSRVGIRYYWCLAVVFVSMALLSGMRWAEDYHLFVLGALSFTAATIGRTALRRRWSGWVRLHISGMGLSYVLLLTAFYVDNGPNLPLWRELPTLAYWLVPGAVGLPLILRALLWHPLVRHRHDVTPASGTT
jgi:hypothetical protein